MFLCSVFAQYGYLETQRQKMASFSLVLCSLKFLEAAPPSKILLVLPSLSSKMQVSRAVRVYFIGLITYTYFPSSPSYVGREKRLLSECRITVAMSRTQQLAYEYITRVTHPFSE